MVLIPYIMITIQPTEHTQWDLKLIEWPCWENEIMANPIIFEESLTKVT